MQTHKKGNHASDISIIYFQTHKLKHLYKKNASLVFVKTTMTSAHLGAQVLTRR